jgi:hypothetical protein
MYISIFLDDPRVSKIEEGFLSTATKTDGSHFLRSEKYPINDIATPILRAHFRPFPGKAGVNI